MTPALQDSGWVRRVLSRLQEPGQVCGVAGGGGGSGRGGLGNLVEVFVVGLAHRRAVPIGAALRGDGEADVVEGLKRLGDDVVRPVLVADDRDDGDLAEKDWPAVG